MLADSIAHEPTRLGVGDLYRGDGFGDFTAESLRAQRNRSVITLISILRWTRVDGITSTPEQCHLLRILKTSKFESS